MGFALRTIFSAHSLSKDHGRPIGSRPSRLIKAALQQQSVGYRVTINLESQVAFLPGASAIQLAPIIRRLISGNPSAYHKLSSIITRAYHRHGCGWSSPSYPFWNFSTEEEDSTKSRRCICNPRQLGVRPEGPLTNIHLHSILMCNFEHQARRSHRRVYA
jgi:hypothetical protein